MPRVNTQTKSSRGREISCSRCGTKIEPGQKYFKWSFRYGGTYANCEKHYPRQSELTQSKLGEVYAACEGMEDEMGGFKTADEFTDSMTVVAEVVHDVAEEYREAAEPFGGEGENAERADELESWADELSSFSPDDDTELEEIVEEAEQLLSGCPL